MVASPKKWAKGKRLREVADPPILSFVNRVIRREAGRVEFGVETAVKNASHHGADSLVRQRLPVVEKVRERFCGLVDTAQSRDTEFTRLVHDTPQRIGTCQTGGNTPPGHTSNDIVRGHTLSRGKKKWRKKSCRRIPTKRGQTTRKNTRQRSQPARGGSMKLFGEIASAAKKGSLRSYVWGALIILLCALIVKCNCEQIANLILFFHKAG